MTDRARYASTLLPRAIAALRVLAPLSAAGARLSTMTATATATAKVLAALDAFLAAPGAVTFLAASRALDRAHRDQRLAELGRGAAERSFARALLRLATVPSVDTALLSALQGLPVDPRAGARLAALAALTEAHSVLEARVAGQTENLRRQLAFDRALVDDQPARRIRSAPSRPARAARRSRPPRRKDPEPK